jgi:nitrite reductase/ring-hydroxylating ferredoxin subunit
LKGKVISMPEFVRVCSVSEVPSGTVKAVTVRNRAVAVFNLNGGFYAAGDTCPHEGAPLSSGCLEGENIICSWHGAAFHVPSGKTLEPPAGEKMGPPVDRGLTFYAVRVTGTDLEIEIGGD